MADSINPRIEGPDEARRARVDRSDAAWKAVAAIEAVGRSHRGRVASEVTRELRRRIPEGTVPARDIRDIARRIARY